jgi:hypothetical protein
MFGDRFGELKAEAGTTPSDEEGPTTDLVRIDGGDVFEGGFFAKSSTRHGC